jgi:TusE/DsrC/DsvC family sulfur relay protein
MAGRNTTSAVRHARRPSTKDPKCTANTHRRKSGMAKTNLGGTEIEIDEDGFIQEPDKWNNAMAEDIAKLENAFPMGEDHWKIVNYLRDYYVKFEIAPPIRMLCKQTGLDLKKIYQLFPSGPAKGACKIAGLPKPTGCV